MLHLLAEADSGLTIDLVYMIFRIIDVGLSFSIFISLIYVLGKIERIYLVLANDVRTVPAEEIAKAVEINAAEKAKGTNAK
jgi:hypothetical protein